MTQYAGSTTTYPISVPLVDDLSPPTALEYNPGLQGLADRTAWLKYRGIDMVGGGSYNPTQPVIVPLSLTGGAGDGGFFFTVEGSQVFDYVNAPYPPAYGTPDWTAGSLATFGSHGGWHSQGHTFLSGPTFAFGQTYAQYIESQKNTVDKVFSSDGSAATDQGYFQWVGSELKRVLNQTAILTNIDISQDLWLNTASGVAGTSQVCKVLSASTVTPNGSLPRVGCQIRFTTATTLGGFTLQRENGTTICVLPSGQPGWAEFTYTGNNYWVCSAWSGNASGIVTA